MSKRKQISQKFIDIGNAWGDFDITTAYGCAQRDMPYDRERCIDAFKAYNATLTKYYPGAFIPSPFHNLEIN